VENKYGAGDASKIDMTITILEVVLAELLHVAVNGFHKSSRMLP